MFFTFLVILVISIAVMSAFTSNLKGPKIVPKMKPFNYPAVEKSHDFHEPVGQFEGNHADRVGRRLISHPEAEPGYVVLNGVKHRIEDCKNL